jgi:hypothetical protein
MRKLDIYVFITIIVLIPLLVDPEGIILPFFIASSLTWLSICIILPFFIASSLTWLSICIILPFFIASSLTWLSICIYILDLQFPNCKSKLMSLSLSWIGSISCFIFAILLRFFDLPAVNYLAVQSFDNDYGLLMVIPEMRRAD